MKFTLFLLFSSMALAGGQMVKKFKAVFEDPEVFRFEGDGPDHRLGYSISGAGDVNADGHGDIVVGIPYDDLAGINAGAVRVFSGKTGEVLYNFYGDEDYDNLGTSVDGAGDVNLDGYDDIVVGAPWVTGVLEDIGMVRVYSGADGSVLYEWFGDSWYGHLGAAVAGAGDVNGDGYADLIAGGPFDDNVVANSGTAEVYSGRDGSILYQFYPDSVYDEMGHDVDGAGDVDGDGFDDVIVGIRFDDGNGTNSGTAKVYSGQTGAVIHTIHGLETGDNLGSAVSGMGDLNGDGLSDFLVGVPGGGDAGRVEVYSGADATLLFTVHGLADGDRFGQTACSAGDVNGDGTPDFIVGAPKHDRRGTDSGAIQVFSGVDGKVLRTFYGREAGDKFGESVGGGVDVHGDGIAEFLVGSQWEDGNGQDSGVARVYSLNP